MKKITFSVKKWTARAFMALGSLLGLSSCFCNVPESVYGPPPVEVIEDVYGPPTAPADSAAEEASESDSNTPQQSPTEP